MGLEHWLSSNAELHRHQTHTPTYRRSRHSKTNKHSKMKLLVATVGFAILSLTLAAPGARKERRAIDWKLLNNMKDKVQQGLSDAQQQFASLNVQGHLDKAHKMAKDSFSQLNLQGHFDNARSILKDNLSRQDVQALRQKVQRHFNKAKSFVNNVDYNSFRSQAQNLFNSLTSGF